MGERDIERQELNVLRMNVLGAEVVPVTTGSRTLKDACNEAMRHWVSSVDDSYYCIGTVMGPHPYPWMVREFQRVIGEEARVQCAAALPVGVPDYVVACIGGGSNAAGTFAGFVDTTARLVGVEAEGGAAATFGRTGVLHGFALAGPPGRATARCRRHTRSRPASTIRGSAPSTPISATAAGPAM